MEKRVEKFKIGNSPFVWIGNELFLIDKSDYEKYSQVNDPAFRGSRFWEIEIVKEFVDKKGQVVKVIRIAPHTCFCGNELCVINHEAKHDIYTTRILQSKSEHKIVDKCTKCNKVLAEKLEKHHLTIHGTPMGKVNTADSGKFHCVECGEAVFLDLNNKEDVSLLEPLGLEIGGKFFVVFRKTGFSVITKFSDLTSDEKVAEIEKALNEEFSYAIYTKKIRKVFYICPHCGEKFGEKEKDEFRYHVKHKHYEDRAKKELLQSGINKEIVEVISKWFFPDALKIIESETTEQIASKLQAIYKRANTFQKRTVKVPVYGEGDYDWRSGEWEPGEIIGYKEVVEYYSLKEFGDETDLKRYELAKEIIEKGLDINKLKRIYGKFREIIDNDINNFTPQIEDYEIVEEEIVKEVKIKDGIDGALKKIQKLISKINDFVRYDENIISDLTRAAEFLVREGKIKIELAWDSFGEIIGEVIKVEGKPTDIPPQQLLVNFGLYDKYIQTYIEEDRRLKKIVAELRRIKEKLGKLENALKDKTLHDYREEGEVLDFVEIKI